MDHRVILTGEFCKGALPGSPPWHLRREVIRRVMENANSKNFPWEVLVAGQKWLRS